MDYQFDYDFRVRRNTSFLGFGFAVTKYTEVPSFAYLPTDHDDRVYLASDTGIYWQYSELDAEYIEVSGPAPVDFTGATLVCPIQINGRPTALTLTSAVDGGLFIDGNVIGFSPRIFTIAKGAYKYEIQTTFLDSTKKTYIQGVLTIDEYVAAPIGS